MNSRRVTLFLLLVVACYVHQGIASLSDADRKVDETQIVYDESIHAFIHEPLDSEMTEDKLPIEYWIGLPDRPVRWDDIDSYFIWRVNQTKNFLLFSRFDQ